MLLGSERVRVTVNGKEEEIPDGLSVAAYITGRGARHEGVVVEYNGTVLPRPEWPARILRAGDRLEVVRFVQGG